MPYTQGWSLTLLAKRYQMLGQTLAQTQTFDSQTKTLTLLYVVKQKNKHPNTQTSHIKHQTQNTILTRVQTSNKTPNTNNIQTPKHLLGRRKQFFDRQNEFDLLLFFKHIGGHAL